MRHRSRLGLLLCAGAASLAMAESLTVTQAEAATIFVSPRGGARGSGTAGAPFGSIQQAVNVAQPGDTIRLMPGRYYEDVRTVRHGAPNAPITIVGSRGSVVQGAGSTRVIQVSHSFIELRGFTIDGKHAAREEKKSYRDKLLYVMSETAGQGVQGVRVIGMNLRNGGGECLRLRYQARNNEVAHSNFENCGVHDFRFNDGGKNGEGVYIGTSPKQLGKWGAPDRSVDQSSGNWIHHNSFNTRGNECVDIKEGSSGNVVEKNRCTGQRDKNSAGLDSRGSGNVFRYNRVSDSKGAGVRLGGHGNEGVANQVYGNTFVRNEVGGVKVMRGPQAHICGNRGGPAVGSRADGIDPTASCKGERAVSRKTAQREVRARSTNPRENRTEDSGRLVR